MSIDILIIFSLLLHFEFPNLGQDMMKYLHLLQELLGLNHLFTDLTQATLFMKEPSPVEYMMLLMEQVKSGLLVSLFIVCWQD